MKSRTLWEWKSGNLDHIRKPPKSDAEIQESYIQNQIFKAELSRHCKRNSTKSSSSHFQSPNLVYARIIIVRKNLLQLVRYADTTYKNYTSPRLGKRPYTSTTSLESNPQSTKIVQETCNSTGTAVTAPINSPETTRSSYLHNQLLLSRAIRMRPLSFDFSILWCASHFKQQTTLFLSALSQSRHRALLRLSETDMWVRNFDFTTYPVSKIDRLNVGTEIESNWCCPNMKRKGAKLLEKMWRYSEWWWRRRQVS